MLVRHLTRHLSNPPNARWTYRFPPLPNIVNAFNFLRSRRHHMAEPIGVASGLPVRDRDRHDVHPARECVILPRLETAAPTPTEKMVPSFQNTWSQLLELIGIGMCFGTSKSRVDGWC